MERNFRVDFRPFSLDETHASPAKVWFSRFFLAEIVEQHARSIFSSIVVSLGFFFSIFLIPAVYRIVELKRITRQRSNCCKYRPQATNDIKQIQIYMCTFNSKSDPTTTSDICNCRITVKRIPFSCPKYKESRCKLHVRETLNGNFSNGKQTSISSCHFKWRGVV